MPVERICPFVRGHQLQLLTALFLFGCKSVVERPHLYFNDKSVFEVRRKSDKGDGKYVNRKFATFPVKIQGSRGLLSNKSQKVHRKGLEHKRTF